jgi:two-component system response regulator RegX3
MPKILLVEDERSIAEGLKISLESEGFQVGWAKDGNEALTAWERARPDLIVLDLMLPGISGTEVCRTIRARSDVPIIMLTARDTEVDRVVGLEIGADDYLTKPFSTRELIARIRAILRRAPLGIGDVRRRAADRGVGCPRRPPRHEVTVDDRRSSCRPRSSTCSRCWSSTPAGC